MRLNQCVDLFLTEKQLEDCTPATIAFYQYTIGKLLHYMEIRRPNMTMEELPAQAPSYFLWLKEESGLSVQSYQSHLRGLKAFFRYLEAEGHLPVPVRIPKIRQIKAEIKPLSRSNIRVLLSSFDADTFLGLRDKTLFSLMLDTGLRLAEVASLEVNDIDLQAGYLSVVGKGRKQRYVPFGGNSKKLLWHYCKQRISNAKPGVETLFVARTGSRLPASGIQTQFRRVRDKLGLTDRFSAHLLRHTFAVHYVNNGGDAFSLQRILGHTTQEMTSRYVHLSPMDIKEQHHKCSPMDHI